MLIAIIVGVFVAGGLVGFFLSGPITGTSLFRPVAREVEEPPISFRLIQQKEYDSIESGLTGRQVNTMRVENRDVEVTSGLRDGVQKYYVVLPNRKGGNSGLVFEFDEEPKPNDWEGTIDVIIAYLEDAWDWLTGDGNGEE